MLTTAKICVCVYVEVASVAAPQPPSTYLSLSAASQQPVTSGNFDHAIPAVQLSYCSDIQISLICVLLPSVTAPSEFNRIRSCEEETRYVVGAPCNVATLRVEGTPALIKIDIWTHGRSMPVITFLGCSSSQPQSSCPIWSTQHSSFGCL